MRYLNRQAKKRKDPRRIDSRGRSAVVVIDNYYYEEAEQPQRFRIARYARGQDYHIATMQRLELLADWLLERGATWARPFTDAGPVPERELAQRAGLGWIGKNTMLLRPGVGSWFVIGSVINDLELHGRPAFETDHCGSCTRCLDACPTDAFVEPRLLDATRCISYQTIEHRGTDPSRYGGADGRVDLRLRHLQRGLPLEPAVRRALDDRRVPAAPHGGPERSRLLQPAHRRRSSTKSSPIRRLRGPASSACGGNGLAAAPTGGNVAGRSIRRVLRAADQPAGSVTGGGAASQHRQARGLPSRDLARIIGYTEVRVRHLRLTRL